MFPLCTSHFNFRSTPVQGSLQAESTSGPTRRDNSSHCERGSSTVFGGLPSMSKKTKDKDNENDQPAVTLPATVEKIIPPTPLGEPERHRLPWRVPKNCTRDSRKGSERSSLPRRLSFAARVGGTFVLFLDAIGQRTLVHDVPGKQFPVRG